MSEFNKSDSVVIIPTYNEKENITLIIQAVIGLNHQFDILVVDDNSPDGTGDIVKERQKRYYIFIISDNWIYFVRLSVTPVSQERLQN